MTRWHLTRGDGPESLSTILYISIWLRHKYYLNANEHQKKGKSVVIAKKCSSDNGKRKKKKGKGPSELIYGDRLVTGDTANNC